MRQPIQYDHLGRQKVAQTFLSAHHYTYDPATFALASGTIIDLQTSSTNVINRTTDALGRDSGFSLGVANQIETVRYSRIKHV